MVSLNLVMETREKAVKNYAQFFCKIRFKSKINFSKIL